MAQVGLTAGGKRSADKPADLIAEWTPLVRKLEPDAELDFSFKADAITICDMRSPSNLRYGNLFARSEIERNLHRRPGELERRIEAFMARG